MKQYFYQKYIDKVFELIPEARFVAVNEDGRVTWSSSKMELKKGNFGFWYSTYLDTAIKSGSHDSLGYIHYPNYEISQNKRTQISNKSIYNDKYIKNVFDLIPEANEIAINSLGIVLWSKSVIYKLDKDWFNPEYEITGSLGIINYKDYKNSLRKR